MTLVFCPRCRSVLVDPGGVPGLELCPQCGVKPEPVPATVVTAMIAPAVRDLVKAELLRRQYVEPRPATFPIATTPPAQEDECRPA